MKQKWYLQTWFICVLFACWWAIIPAILGVILLFVQHKDNVHRQEQLVQDTTAKVTEVVTAKVTKEVTAKVTEELIEGVKEEKRRLGLITKDEIETENRNFENKRAKHESTIKELDTAISDKKAKLEEMTRELSLFDDEITYLDFGFYEPKYNCVNSEEYKAKISEVRQAQKAMVKDKKALNYFDGWSLDGSQAKGRALNNDNMKMVLLAFNGECDSIISKVKFNNVMKVEERIEKIAKKIDKLNERNKISITPKYLDLKREELYLCYEYEQKKQEEKEEIRRIREEEREEQKLKKEIEEARKKVEKEQAHFSQALEQLEKKLILASDDEKVALLAKKEDIENHLVDIDKEIKDIDYREANQKAGYVYVISNIGSFGEDVYKIGMTRRLDPQDRIDELGDASVPFRFDVHAMIFSEDAPALEAALHRAFDDKKVNMINNRKEFFHVTLEEIEAEVKKNYDKTVDFVKIPSAEQYRETQMMLKSLPN